MESVESWIAEDKNYDEDILELDETKITKITPKLKEQFEKYKSLVRLSMVGCDLRSLDNFPTISTLQYLELIDNKIKGEELGKLPSLPNLKNLSLSSNPINSVQDLKPLTKFNKTIESLSLQECPLTKNDNYRQEVFQIIGGSLQVVDLQDREGKEVGDQSQVDEDQQDDEDDDVEGDLIEDDEEGSQPLAGKRKAPQKGLGKQQDDEDDDEEDSEGEYDQDEDDGQDEDQDSDEQEKGASKKVKRS